MLSGKLVGRGTFWCPNYLLFLLPGEKVGVYPNTGIAPLAEDCLVVELSRSLGSVDGFCVLQSMYSGPIPCGQLLWRLHPSLPHGLATCSGGRGGAPPGKAEQWGSGNSILLLHVLFSSWPCLHFPSRSSSTTTTSPIRSAAFPSASTLRSSLSAADGYAAPLDPAILQKEASRGREAKTERAQTDNNIYTSKLPSGANLEQSPSPIKAMESRPLPASGPGSSHHYGRGQGKSQQHHHPLDQQHAASGSEQHSREKSQSKRFSMQEQELRALGKSTTTAAWFTDVIVMQQMSCDKG